LITKKTRDQAQFLLEQIRNSDNFFRGEIQKVSVWAKEEMKKMLDAFKPPPMAPLPDTPGTGSQPQK
jgi:hypothetical protein